VVLEALLVNLEMTAMVLEFVEGVTFETPHTDHGGRHNVATVAYHLKIRELHWSLVMNWESCCMQNADNTLEHVEMAALKVGTLTPAPDDIDWFISQIDRLCQ
jgi:hypothetical protein